MKIEPGVIFVYVYLIIMFPFQLIYYIPSKILNWKYCKFMDIGLYFYLDDTLIPMMQSTQGIINAKGNNLDVKDLFSKVK